MHHEPNSGHGHWGRDRQAAQPAFPIGAKTGEAGQATPVANTLHPVHLEVTLAPAPVGAAG